MGVWGRSTGQKFTKVKELELQGGRATWKKARTKMKLSGCLCASSPPSSCLVCWLSRCQAACFSHNGSESLAMEFHDPLEPQYCSPLDFIFCFYLIVCLPALFPEGENLRDWAQLCSGRCHWLKGDYGPEALRQGLLQFNHLWPEGLGHRTFEQELSRAQLLRLPPLRCTLFCTQL